MQSHPTEKSVWTTINFTVLSGHRIFKLLQRFNPVYLALENSCIWFLKSVIIGFNSEQPISFSIRVDRAWRLKIYFIAACHHWQTKLFHLALKSRKHWWTLHNCRFVSKWLKYTGRSIKVKCIIVFKTWFFSYLQ